DPKRGLEQLGQYPSRRAGGLRQPEGLADLAQDLRLTHDHRLQAADHAEQVRHRTLAVMHVEVRRERVESDPGMGGQQVADLVDAAVEGGGVDVELEAIAGAHHDRLGQVRRRGQLVEHLRHVIAPDGDVLEDVDRCAAMRQTDGQDAHPFTASASSAACDGVSESWAAFLRCSRYARICSAVDRSTVRRSTPSGTCTMAGAKFRMLVTPAATRRSQTGWAALAGVATTPMWMSRSLISCS